MKRFTKITLILAGVLAMIGLACMLASFAMGLTLESFSNMVVDGKFSFRFPGEAIIRQEQSVSTTIIDEECQNLEVEFEAGQLQIYYADVEEIQIEQKNVPDFKAKVEKKTLRIDGDTDNRKSSDGSIVIVLPQNMKFEEVDLEIGASMADINDIEAKNFTIEVGAGEAAISNLDVKDLDVNTGVGKVTVELVGKESDYNYNVECGIGSIEVGENSYSGLGTKQKISNPGADRSMNVECGIGEVQIRFGN